MRFEKISWFVRDIEINKIEAALFHFEVDRTGDHITWCQLGAFVVLRHEAFAGFALIRQAQVAAFTANRLRDQIRLGKRVVKAGGVKLDKFHVGDTAACAPPHGHAVAGGNVWVGGIQVDLAGTTGREHRKARVDGMHRTVEIVQSVCAVTAIFIGPAKFL